MTTPLALEREPIGHTAVYRLFAIDGRLLYVGMTGTLLVRLRQHAKEKDWWPEVTRREVAWHRERADAEHEETRAILTESPKHNLARPPSRPAWRHADAQEVLFCPIAKARLSVGARVDAAFYLEEPTVVTKNGTPRAVLVSHKFYEEALAALGKKPKASNDG